MDIGQFLTIIVNIIVITITILQAIRQWDQALREKNDYRDALAKVKSKCDDDHGRILFGPQLLTYGPWGLLNFVFCAFGTQFM